MYYAQWRPFLNLKKKGHKCVFVFCFFVIHSAWWHSDAQTLVSICLNRWSEKIHFHFSLISFPSTPTPPRPPCACTTRPKIVVNACGTMFKGAQLGRSCFPCLPCLHKEWLICCCWALHYRQHLETWSLPKLCKRTDTARWLVSACKVLPDRAIKAIKSNLSWINPSYVN